MLLHQHHRERVLRDQPLQTLEQRLDDDRREALERLVEHRWSQDESWVEADWFPGDHDGLQSYEQLRALAAVAVPGHSPRRYVRHAYHSLFPARGEGLREAAERLDARVPDLAALVREERDPAHRIVLNPITDDASRVVGGASPAPIMNSPGSMRINFIPSEFVKVFSCGKSPAPVTLPDRQKTAIANRPICADMFIVEVEDKRVHAS